MLPPPPPPPTEISWLIEPRRPDRVRRSRHAPALVVATVCLGAFMGQLDASIVTLALPAMRQQFHASVGTIEWVSLAYLVSLVVLVLPVGRLADMLGRKLLYVYGFAIFTAASVMCGLAPNLAVLVSFRVVQAVGAALLQANSVALIAASVPRERLGRPIGMQAAAQAVGLAVGPAVGGVLVAAGGWRWVFLVNAPVGLLGAVSGIVLLPRTRTFSPRARFDWLGFAFFASGTGTLLFALSYVRQGSVNPAALAMLVVGVIIGTSGFALRERRTRLPLLPTSLFARPGAGGGLIAGLLCYLALFGVLFSTPFLLAARHESSARIGLILTALPAAIAAAAPIGGRLADRVGPRLPTTVGMVITSAGLLLISGFLPTDASLAGLLAVVGVGLGMFTPANNAAIMGSASASDAGATGGVLNMTRGIGTSLGVAVAGLFLVGRGGVAGGNDYRHAILALAACTILCAGLSLLRTRATA